MADQHELSQEAHDRLSAELQDLRTRGRIELAARIEAARELGDLRENAEYHAAKEEKAKMETRVAKLHGILENAVVVEVSDSEGVCVGSIVSIRYEGDDEIERYLVGSIEERHDEVHVVSPTSPLGQVLLGRNVGETVSYDAPRGPLSVEIVEIEF